MDATWAGLLLVAAGGAMQGSFALPQKFVRGWAWERTWLLYSVCAMVVFPWLLAPAVVPHLGEVYAVSEPGVLARTAFFGLGWGAGSVMFGLGIARLGMALGFAIIMSVIAAVGSLVPVAVLHPDQFFARRGAMLVLGLAIVVTGLALCAKAGRLREAAARRAPGEFARGLLLSIGAGLLSSMMNFSYAFGDPIATEAVRRGASTGDAAFAVFTVAVTAGFFVNAGYCVYLMARRRISKAGAPAARNMLLACAMGFLWLFGFFLYGQGIRRMGDLGAAVGWPLFMMVMVLSANLWSLATGEWRDAGPRALRYLGAGMAVLLVALAVIAAGTQA